MKRYVILSMISVMLVALIGGCCSWSYENGGRGKSGPWKYSGDGMMMPRNEVQFNN